MIAQENVALNNYIFLEICTSAQSTWKPISHLSLRDSCDIGFRVQFNSEFPPQVMNFPIESTTQTVVASGISNPMMIKIEGMFRACKKWDKGKKRERGPWPLHRNTIRTSETFLRWDERNCETVCKVKSVLTMVFPVTTAWFRWSCIQNSFAFHLEGFQVCYLFPVLFQPSLVFQVTHNSLKQWNK